MTTAAKAFFSGLVSLWLVAGAQAQFGGDLLAGNGRARGAVIPIFLGTERQPALVVRADQIYQDYQRKGFFRIGVLPIGVMEGVTFDVRHVGSLTHSLVQLEHGLSPRAASRLEFRQATIQIVATVTNRLQAGRIRVLPGGTWALAGDVRLQMGTNQIQAASATLQVSGKHTGTLVLATAPRWTTNFFALATSEPSTQ